MKKLFAILAISAFLTSCGGDDASKTEKSTADSSSMAKDAMKTDSATKAAMDTTKKMVNDASKMVDTAKKTMDKAADKMKDAASDVKKAADKK